MCFEPLGLVERLAHLLIIVNPLCLLLLFLQLRLVRRRQFCHASRRRFPLFLEGLQEVMHLGGCIRPLLQEHLLERISYHSALFFSLLDQLNLPALLLKDEKHFLLADPLLLLHLLHHGFDGLLVALLHILQLLPHLFVDLGIGPVDHLRYDLLGHDCWLLHRF